MFAAEHQRILPGSGEMPARSLPLRDLRQGIPLARPEGLPLLARTRKPPNGHDPAVDLRGIAVEVFDGAIKNLSLTRRHIETSQRAERLEDVALVIGVFAA